ncbi:DUF3168 domain-containing protein [Serratia fonticola]|uniref:tail completion protein gp17 n=1 Tax=Serratia fonticola TaxID=47917 RepID=UPI0015C58793|nr:DUF3168 domain-containing protein [Serratia fonticola]NYA43142.1 DUF3168 domain-containing protein [Serratia fonticola]
MTEADLKTLLKPLVGGQAYPYVVKLTPKGKPAVEPPWIIYTVPDEQRGDVFCGTAETASMVQIDVYAASIDEAKDIREQAEAAVSPLLPAEVHLFSGHEPDTGLFRASLEFKVWR